MFSTRMPHLSRSGQLPSLMAQRQREHPAALTASRQANPANQTGPMESPPALDRQTAPAAPVKNLELHVHEPLNQTVGQERDGDGIVVWVGHMTSHSQVICGVELVAFKGAVKPARL